MKNSNLYTSGLLRSTSQRRGEEHFPFLSQIDPATFHGKRILVRASLNVPIEGGRITDSFRLESLAPTLDFLRSAGASTILISHHDGENESQSLLPVAVALGARFVPAVPNSLVESNSTRGSSSWGCREVLPLVAGEVVVLENLRLDPREKANDAGFASELAALADIFVNEDFGTSHREHASIVGVPKYLPSFFGFQFEREVCGLSLAFEPTHPFLFILGGAKFSTKVPLVRSFLGSADTIFIAGALANTFFKAKGYEVGHSLVDTDFLDLSGFLDNPKIEIPQDVLAMRESYPATDLEAQLPSSYLGVELPSEISHDQNMVDIGPATMATLEAEVASAKFILWNGPLGVFEKGFRESTERLAKAIAASSATSVVGGGDTLAAIKALRLEGKPKNEGGFDFVSTAGGAMLDFLAKRTLPGIEAVMEGNR